MAIKMEAVEEIVKIGDLKKKRKWMLTRWF
jgi:hypothetical protein